MIIVSTANKIFFIPTSYLIQIFMWSNSADRRWGAIIYVKVILRVLSLFNKRILIHFSDEINN